MDPIYGVAEANRLKMELEKYIQILSGYSACDISDALLKLKVPGAGFLADIGLHSPALSTLPLRSIFTTDGGRSTHRDTKPTIAPAHTVLFLPKTSPVPSALPPSTHFADLTPPNTITVISQPPNQRNAVLGGLVAARIKKLNGLGIVVDGRIRDVSELWGLSLKVWAKGTSTVGAGGESKCVSVGEDIEVEGVKVSEGDIIFADPIDGVVSIPKDKLDAVIELLPKITRADQKVRSDVMHEGSGLQEAFDKHRKGI
ncbi:hypothetical protein TWF694_010929 [Orbilia ellipsospora]|uniref:Uncharacterized protein n=1 Tax=Orbilia ellipsospora TaxID=2528407 RepID=A0AAV9X7T4_9PEZI